MTTTAPVDADVLKKTALRRAANRVLGLIARFAPGATTVVPTALGHDLAESDRRRRLRALPRGSYDH